MLHIFQMSSLNIIFTAAIHHAFPQIAALATIGTSPLPPAPSSTTTPTNSTTTDSPVPTTPLLETYDFAIAVITRCGNPTFGDFQCNNAMAIAKFFKSYPGEQS